MKNINIEELIFSYVDKVKTVISNELWEDMLLNSTKNEVFILLFLYRNHQVNMTQIAEYIQVPLNTATGIAARMEKRGWILRSRSLEDKRVVTILLTDQGMEHMNKILNEFIRYGTRIMTEVTSVELQVLNDLFDKIMKIFEEELGNKEDNSLMCKKVIKKINIE